jgi:ribonuclease BN (tRNA processing enzyme)
MRALSFGTADGHTSPDRDHSGVLLQGAGESFLLDCGAPAGRLLLHDQYGPDVPGALWISHMHSDHVGQVGSLIQSLWLRQRRATLHIFGPAEVMRAVKDWLERCLLFPDLVGFPIEWHDMNPGQPFAHGAFTLTAFSTAHLASLSKQFRKAYPNTCFDCFGLILEEQGQRYVYSADIDHPRDLDPALKAGRVHALICELTHFPERELFRHLAPFQVDSVWLTHYPDRLVRQEAQLRAMAREEKFLGSLYLMQDNVAHDM